MKIKYLGHATVQLESNGKTLLVDPFISGNPLAVGIDINLLKADYILITHGHQDHVLDVEPIAKRTGATLISNFEIISWFEKRGLTGHPMNHGGKFSFDFGTVKYVNAVHSSVLPDGANGGNPGGFVIWNEDKSIYIAGDTALTQDMAWIPKTCPKLDLAILPIGDNFTMGYEDAIHASELLQCPNIMGYHYNTFPPIKIDTQKAINAFHSANKKLILLPIGEDLLL